MAAPTRRKHGHVAGLRRRPFNPTMVDKPSGVIEEPDEDEVSTESLEAAYTDPEDTEDTEDTEDAVDDVAQDIEADSPEDVAEPAEAETEVEQVAAAEPASDGAVEIEPAEPVVIEEQPEPAPAEADSTQEHTDEQVEAATVTEELADGVASAEPEHHSDLFAWLVGDGESLADLLGSAKQPETHATPGQPPPRPAPRPLARPPRLDRQSFRRATDVARPAAPPLAPPPPPRAVSPPTKPKPRRRRTAILVAAIVVAVALVAGVVALLLPGSGNDNGAAGRGGATSAIALPAQTAQPVTWAKQNLPSGAAIVAPAALVPGLQAAGFTTVYADDALTGLSLANVAYLVGEPTVTPPAADLEKFVNATAALAFFGTGSAQTMVGEVFAGGTSAMAKAMLADTKLRAQEGSELLNNPNVHTDVAMRKVLANGLLDARAGALISVLAGGGQVTVTDPVRAAPEAAAGLAYRTLTVSMPNTVFLDNSVRRADPKYKPASVVAVGPDARRLIWTPAVAPDKPFS